MLVQKRIKDAFQTTVALWSVPSKTEFQALMTDVKKHKLDILGFIFAPNGQQK